MKKRKNTIKFRLLAAVAGMLLVSGALTGCQKGENQGAEKQQTEGNTDQEQTQGRYTARKTELPFAEGEHILGAVKKEDVVQVYTSIGAIQEPQIFYSYTWQGESWGERTEETGLGQTQTEQFLQVNRIFQGQDGRTYGHAVTMDTEKVPYGSHILRMTEAGVWEDMTPGEFLKPDGEGYTIGIPDAAVLADGSLCVMNWDTDQIEVYREGKHEASMQTAAANSEWAERVSVSQDTIAVVGAGNSEISFYQTLDFKPVGKVEMEVEEENFTLLPGEEGIWYALDTRGIHRFSTDGSIVETVMNGSYGQMSNAENMIEAIWYEGEGAICAMYRNYTDDTLSMERYAFDEELDAVPEETLTVYSLKENDTVAQAVNVFQQENPEIKMEYTFSFEKDAFVSDEQLRTLNTQLLNGDGADVLILDGLPLDSYIEKGILADLSGMEEELRAQGVFLDVVRSTAEADGKLYGIPARIGVPLSYGSEEAYQAMQSLEQLTVYLEQQPQKWILPVTFHDWAARQLLAVMYEEVVQDGQVQEEKLKQLITCWMKICEGMNTKQIEADAQYDVREYAGTENYFMQIGVGLSDNSQDCLVMTEFNGSFSMQAPWYEMRERGLEPRSISQYYIPHAIGGINAASSKQELAGEFLKTLLGDEVQCSMTDDGLPITEKGWEQLAAYMETKADEEGFAVSAVHFVTGEEITLRYGYPSAEEVKKTEDFVKTLTKPLLPNRVFWETALEKMEKCYVGTETVETAAETVCRKMDTYLAE